MGRVRGGGGRAVKRSFVSPVGVGVLSVITVLLVLTISLFAALAVSTASLHAVSVWGRAKVWGSQCILKST